MSPHKFDPRNKELLERKERKSLYRINPTLKLLRIKKGTVVVDLGCGTGYWTIPLARKTAPGLVYACDISPEMLTEVKKKKAEKKLSNIRMIQTKENSFPLADKSIDYILLSYVVHELFNRRFFFKAIKRILRKDGLLGIIEWNKRRSPFGPPTEERIAPREMEYFLKKQGFIFLDKFPLGRYNYGIISRPSD